MVFSQSLRQWLSIELKEAILAIAQKNKIDIPAFEPRIDYPPNFSFGEYASPQALNLARIFKKNPYEIAQEIKDYLSVKPDFQEFVLGIEIAPPGFINFRLKTHVLRKIFPDLRQIFFQNWVKSLFPEKEQKIILEFVSANPTGPLNIVSARAAAFGDSLSRILRFCGFPVFCEYYVNDFGNQIYWLGISLAYRYAQSLGLAVNLPENAYQGEYLIDLAKELCREIQLKNPPNVENEFSSWAEEAARLLAPLAVKKIVQSQKQDLLDFQVFFDNFFYESGLHPQKVQETFEFLKNKNHLYEKEGAWFLETSRFQDDKDRVVIRSDGRPTYFLADIAYHRDKINRGFQKIINIWGPDHHGYIPRMRAALKALGFFENEKNDFTVLICQQVNLWEEGKPVVMSKRLGKFQTMRDLLVRIPVDVCRYFFVMRGASNHLDFDLELATNQSEKNPVYYIQYAHARIHSIFRQAKLNFADFVVDFYEKEEFLQLKSRRELLFYLLRLPEEIADIAQNYEVQGLATYLYELANYFTQFYSQKEENNILRKLKENPEEGRTLLSLIKLVAEALALGLSLLGISAPTALYREEDV